MIDEKYLLSIVIPTKNRQAYAIKSIEQIMSIKSERIQLVVQDNSDDDRLRNLVSKYENEERLKYNYSNEVLSFVDNFSEAITLAEGEYICMIGDDDGILPDILNLTKWLKDNNVDAATPTVNAVYIWPSSVAFVKNAENGYMCISYVNEKVSLCDTKEAIIELMSYGGQKYLSTNLVKLYHGVVKKSCMDLIRNITGHYFGGLSPDIYASVALSIISNKVVKIKYPITISGICQTSGSADSATGKHTGELKYAPHFKGHTLYNWSEEVPAFYSVETIWADTALQALKELNATEYINKFNIAALNMYCLKKYHPYKEIVVEHCKKNKIGKFNLLIEYIRLPLMDYIKRCINRIFRKKNDVIKEYNVKDINMAQKIIIEYLHKNNISCENLLKNLDSIN